VGKLIPHLQFCDAVSSEIATLSSVFRGVDPAVHVTTCSEWTMRDLAQHTGAVHRWAGQMVAGLCQSRLPNDEVVLNRPPDFAAFPEWLDEGGALLTEALRAVDPEAAMWSWGADKHARFWSRRQVHETVVHRADAEITLGIEPKIEDWIAIDGVDEFLANAPHALRFAPNVENLRGDGEVIAFVTDDARWSVTLLPDRFEWSHHDARADVKVEGAPADIYLFAWGRRKAEDARRFTVEGDRELLKKWVENSAL